MAQSSITSPSTQTSHEQLTTAVERLTEHVRVLTDLVQATRDELQWIIQNGVPHQPLSVRIDSPTSVISSAADDGPQIPTVPEIDPAAGHPVTEQGLHDDCEWLIEEFGALAQEQLNLLVTAQNDLKREIVAAVTKTLATTTPAAQPGSPPSRTVVPAIPPTDSGLAPIPVPPERPVMHTPRSFSFEDEPSPPESPAASPPLPSVVADISPPVELSTLPPVPLWDVGDAVEFEIDHRCLWGEIIELNDAENTATIQLIPSDEVVTVSQDELDPEWASHQHDHRRAGIDPPEDAPFLESAPAHVPVTLATFMDVQQRLQQGTITADELRRRFAPCYAARSAFCATLVQRLNRSELQALAGALRCLDAVARRPKDILALNCYHALLAIFTLDQPLVWRSVMNSYEDAVADMVSHLTDDDLRTYTAATSPPDPQTPPFAADLTPFVALLSRSRR